MLTNLSYTQRLWYHSCGRYAAPDASNAPECSRSSATAKSTVRPSCLVDVLFDISREKICWWLINHFYVFGHEGYRIRQNNAKCKIMAITPFEVIQDHRFWYQSKAHIRLPISDYSTNFPPILHRLQVMADYRLCQIFASDRRALHFNALA